MLMLDSDSETGQLLAAGAVGALAFGCPANAAAISVAGGLPPLVRLMGSCAQGVQAVAAEALMSVSRGVCSHTLPGLVQVLNSDNEAAQRKTVEALQFLEANSWLTEQDIAAAGGALALMQVVRTWLIR